MTLRGLVREIKEFPSTTTFCLLWIVVFAAMVGVQLAAGTYPTWTKLLVVGIGDGHRFGDLTLDDMARGEYWRLITSTFIHFSVIHLVLNVVAMYQLGTMVESWYGTQQSIFIYGLTGGAGNLVSVLIRHEIGSNPRIHSGGGSVVIMGLVGLAAVAGLRSHTKMGVSLGRGMVFFMVMTAAIGIALPRFIDNWGHAGGALVGAVVGLAHRTLLKAERSPSAWGRGVMTAMLIAACGMAQFVADRRDAPARDEERQMGYLAVQERTYKVFALTDRLVGQPTDGATILKLLDSLSLESAGLRQLRDLARAAGDQRLSTDASREFRQRLSGLLEQARRDYAAERQELWRLRDLPRSGRSR